MANVVAETDSTLLEISKYDFLWCVGGNKDQSALTMVQNIKQLRLSNHAELINQ
jgi:hypothetical protein